VSVTGNKYLFVAYDISSVRLELVVMQSKDGNTKSSNDDSSRSYFTFPLDSNEETVYLVAKKIGVTTNVEYILVSDLEVVSYDVTSNAPLLHYRTVFVIGEVGL